MELKFNTQVPQNCTVVKVQYFVQEAVRLGSDILLLPFHVDGWQETTCFQDSSSAPWRRSPATSWRNPAVARGVCIKGSSVNKVRKLSEGFFCVQNTHTLLAMYVSANHRSVEALLFLMFSCQFYIVTPTALTVWLGVGAKRHSVRVRRRSCFGLKYLFWSPENMAGRILGSR